MTFLFDLVLSNFTFTYFSFPIFFVAFACFGVGLATLIKNKPTPLYLTFLLFTSVISAWQLSLIFMISSNNIDTALLCSKILLSLICLIPSFLYTFTLFLNSRFSSEKYYFVTMLTGAIFLIYEIFNGSRISNGIYNYSWGYYPKFGDLHYVFLTFIFLSLLKIVHVFIQELRDESSSEIHVQRNKTLLTGAMVGYFSTVDFLPALGYSVLPFGFIFILAGITIYAFAISQYELTGLTDNRIASRIFMTIDEAVFVTNSEGILKLANDATRSLLNIDDSHIEDLNVKNLLTESDIVNLAIENSREDDDFTQDFETRLSGLDGNIYNVKLKMSTILADEKTPSGRRWFVFAADDTTQLKETQQKLDKVTYENSITGFPNERMLERKIDEGDVPESCDSAVYVIIKDLKSLEANLQEQNLYKYLLRSIASRLQVILPTENLYQITDGEFFTFTADGSDLKKQLEARRDDLTSSVDLENETVHVNYAIGIIEDRPVKEAFQLSQSMAVNEASGKPGTAITHYNEDASRDHRRYFDIKHDVIDAIENNQIKVYFHPQITSNGIRGAEALIRWQHDKHGFIAPPEIVQSAIEMNCEKQLLQHVLSKAMQSARKWPSDQKLAVNISSKQLEHKKRIINSIEKASDRQDFSKNRLEIEITEQAAIQDIEKTYGILSSLINKNISVSLDDFGTGYSSFKSLIHLPLDNLKIDKSFVLNLDEDEKNKRIIETTNEMAKNLDLAIIAEGVETTSQVEYLQNLEIQILQGFHWTEPLPEDKYQRYIESFQPNEDESIRTTE